MDAGSIRCDNFVSAVEFRYHVLRMQNVTSRTKLALWLFAAVFLCGLIAFVLFVDEGELQVAECQPVFEQPPAELADLTEGLNTPKNSLEPQVHGEISRVVAGKSDTRVLFFGDKKGKPIANLTIGLRTEWELNLGNAEAPPIDIKVGVTNEAGQVWVNELPKGITSVITLDSDWLIVGSSILDDTVDGVQNFRVLHGGSIVGQVIGPGGPINDATVEAVVTGFLFSAEKDDDIKSLAFDPANHRYAKTDMNGYFRIYGVVQSTSLMFVLADGFSPASPEVQGPQSGDIVDLGEIFVEPGVDCCWSFSPLESLGKNARLFLKKKSAYTRGSFGVPLDSEGKARMTGMEPGKYRWVLEQPGQVGMVGSAVVPESGGTVSIGLPESRDLHVQVVDSDGQSVSDVLIKALESHGRTMQFRGDGEVFVRCNAEAAVKLRVESPGFEVSPSITVPAGRTSVSVKLLRYGRLQLSFPGSGSQAKIAAGLLQNSSAATNMLIAEGISPIPLEDLHLVQNSILIQDVPPGRNWVVVDTGAGPSIFGPFKILESEVSSAEIDVSFPVPVTGTVLDITNSSPIFNAAIHVLGKDKPGIASSLNNAFGFETPRVEYSEEDGSFVVGVPAGASIYISVSASGFEPRILEVNAASRKPVEVFLAEFPRVALSVMRARRMPAKFAEVLFLESATRNGMPSLVGQIQLDADGAAELNEIPEGVYAVTVIYKNLSGVKERASFSSVEVRDSASLNLVLFESPAWISIPAPPGEVLNRVVVQRVGGKEDRRNVVTLSGDSLSDSGSRVLVNAGKYQIRAECGTREFLATCNVVEGEETTILWDDNYGTLSIEINGRDWVKCRLRLELLDGEQMPFLRMASPIRDSGPIEVGDLPQGLYKVKLLDWQEISGKGYEVNWSQIVEVAGAPVTLSYSLEDLSLSKIMLKDWRGGPQGNVRILCSLSGTDSSGFLYAMTDSGGEMELMVPNGDVIFLAECLESQYLIERRKTVGDSEIELVGEAGGQLEVNVSNFGENGGLSFRIVAESWAEDPLVVSWLAPILAQRLAEKSSPAPGVVWIDNIPAGNYVLQALQKGTVVGNASFNIFPNSTSAVQLSLK